MKNIIKKFTSRKFWIAVAGLVSGVVIMLGADAEQSQNVYGVVLSAASVICYIFGEGLCDINAINAKEDNDAENNA